METEDDRIRKLMQKQLDEEELRRKRIDEMKKLKEELRQGGKKEHPRGMGGDDSRYKKPNDRRQQK